MSPWKTLISLYWLNVLVLGELDYLDFFKCLDFFYKKTPPQVRFVVGHQPICQRYKNRYHFASMYQRQHRAPLYSAYIVGLPDGKRPNATWMYEPLLASACANPQMEPFDSLVEQNVIESQAVLQDYRNSSYTRGHLNPSMHQRTKESREATFTLTNIVPQHASSNAGPWNKLELQILKNFKAYCQGPMYVITGAMPYESGVHWLNGRVSVPEYVWSAYCCPSYKTDLPKPMQAFFPTYAALGRNDGDSGEEIVPINHRAKASVRGYDVRRMPLETLEEILSQRLGQTITLFYKQCRQYHEKLK